MKFSALSPEGLGWQNNFFQTRLNAASDEHIVGNAGKSIVMVFSILICGPKTFFKKRRNLNIGRKRNFGYFLMRTK